MARTINKNPKGLALKLSCIETYRQVFEIELLKCTGRWLGRVMYKRDAPP
jgi:hypothetical protein